MNVSELLRGQYSQGHSMLLGVMADVSQQLADEASMGTVGSIASVFAHVAFTEDAIVSGIRGLSSLYERGGWANRLGMSMPGLRQTAEWAGGVRIDLAAFTDYTKAVFDETEAYVGSLAEADLDRAVEGVMGRPVPLAMLVANVGTIHVAEHAGEIAALKGVRGMKGLPF